MAEKRKSKKKQELDGEQPTKEEYAVAKHMRFNTPVKEGRLVGMTVQYFIASEAINCLLDSKWAKNKESLFTTRSSCVNYCNRLLNKGLFHRAEKVVKKKKKKKEEEEDTNGEEDGKKSKKEKKTKKERVKDSGKEGEKKEDKKDEKKEDQKDDKKEEKKDKDKKEKKIKLDMHQDQVFLDGDEVYVWIYDPVNTKTFIIGLLMVLGVIGICVFPLWPPEVRIGVYYCSLGAACLIGVLLSLIVVRIILYILIWLGTFGKHSFWLLPNLTEDVGFFESFVPLYTHEEKSSDSSAKEEKKSKSDSKKKTNKEAKKSNSKDVQPVEERGSGETAAGEADVRDSSEESNEGFEMVEKVPLETGEKE